MRRKIVRALVFEGMAPSPTAAIPDNVESAARAVCGDDAIMDLIREDWPFLQLTAERDRAFGQGGQADSPAYQEALNGLLAFLRWAGPAGEYARGLAAGEALMRCTDPDEFVRRFTSAELDEMEQQAALDVVAVKRLEGLLSRCSLGCTPRKDKKGFLPMLAQLVHEWHGELGLPPPARSNNGPAVKLMRAIASALGVEVSGDAHRKALSSTA